ncbi:MAG: NADH-quinone oxidoreductase subunit NuoG [Actinobacteria bacterium]|nr:NADH-quinone oxidoreductase subunit NuoG [Actinomycetota bacterium]
MTQTEKQTLTVTIDGRELHAEPGALVIKVAEDNGIYIPRFCWHERMKPVGMCRMCLVQIEGARGLPPACTTPVTDGMVVETRNAAVKKVQDGVLEFLLINHPLDCPVCDRGGECPLQDQTLAFGPGESRFVEEKRHFKKPVAISELVLLDRERCIQCGRCTRFADEIAGDPLIDFGERSGEMQVITYPDEPFRSYFSGNTVQICPVGALTSKPYRFKARPWDLASVETSCVNCAVGCRGALQSSTNRLVRLLGVDSEPVNHGWLCDKGRYGFEYVHAPDRVRNPMVRKEGELVETSWPEALDAAADGLRRARDLHGPDALAVLGGARGTNEDAYVWARFAKGVLQTDNVDCQLGDGLPADVLLGAPRATIADCDRAAAVVVLAPDLKEELPVLFLRIKRAAVELGVPLIDVAPRAHGLTRYAAAVVRHAPGEAENAARKLANALTGSVTGDKAIDDAAAAVRDRTGDVVVVLGRPSLADAPAVVVGAAAALLSAPNVRFLSALRRGNVHGALDLGLAPGFLPGRVALDGAREWFASAWGGVPAKRGLDALGILDAARSGRVHGLVLLGADPVADFPDRSLARQGVAGAGFTVAVGAFLNESTKHADVFLPVSLWGEKAGTYTNLEGRVQRAGQKVSPEGTTMPDWRVAAELAARFDHDFDLEAVQEVQDEIARLAPAHAGVDALLIARARDGVVVPLAEHRDELVLSPRRIPITDASWEPILPGSIPDEGLTATRLTDVLEATGTGATSTVKPDVEPVGDGVETEAMVEQAVADATEVAAAAPELYRWSPAADGHAVPPRDAYALRLVAARKLYDKGEVVVRSPSIAALGAEAVLLVNPGDRDRIGVHDGENVRATTGRGSLVLPLRGDATTPTGVAFVWFTQSGPGPADLIDATAPVTDLRLETLK